MQLYFATNRNLIKKDGKEAYGTDFNQASPTEFRVGTVKMKKVKNVWKVGKIGTAEEKSKGIEGTRTRLSKARRCI